MRSLHLVKTSVGATWAYRLMRDLVVMGEEVHVALPTNGPMTSKYTNAGIIVHEINFSLKKFFSTRNKLHKLIKEINPDIIHSHFVLTTLIMRLTLWHNDIPRIFEVPGPLHLEHFIYRKSDLWTARKNDFWIATCKWTYDKYKQCGIQSDRLHLTYYGNDYTETKYAKGKLRKELGLGDGDKIVGMVAYMYAPKKYLGEKRGLKGHEDLIDAFAIIQDKNPQLHLVFVGGAWNNAKKYEEQVITYGKKRCKNIHFLGTRNDVAELYPDFDVVVHPSHSENLGGAAESLCFGIPTIATNIGGFPDIIKNEITGFLVPVSNPPALASAIQKVINDPAGSNKIAQTGKMMTTSLLNSKNTSKSVFDFYRKIVSKKT